MSRYQHSKSGLFLMELLLNLLLFCVLCGCGLMFFIKSNNLTRDTTTLLHAVTITSSVASIYESGDGSFSTLCNEFAYAETEGNLLSIYYDTDYMPCMKIDSACYVMVELLQTTPDKIRIDFYDSEGTVAYSIVACHYTPSVFSSGKEVSEP